MAEISASLVMELRSRTGLGMMECKKALAETGGDMAKAEDLLRIKSGAKASKAAGRVAAEGVVGVHRAADGRGAAIVEVNCETDFVARNEDFIAFARKLAELVAARHPADVAALSALPLDGGTVESVRQALVQKIGENMTIRRFQRFATAAKLATYVHGGSRIGVIVEYDGGDESVGKDVAMHVAASGAPGAVRPVCVSRDQVPAELIAKEREIFKNQAMEEGKPEAIAEKIVEGRVKKFYKEICLLEQPFIKDDKVTIKDLMNELVGVIGENIQIGRFTRLALGEDA